MIYGGFKISRDKTIAVVLSHRKDLDIQLSINNQQVKKVEGRAKFLVVLDSKLNWNDHIKYIEDKCKNVLI